MNAKRDHIDSFRRQYDEDKAAADKAFREYICARDRMNTALHQVKYHTETSYRFGADVLSCFLGGLCTGVAPLAVVAIFLKLGVLSRNDLALESLVHFILGAAFAGTLATLCWVLYMKRTPPQEVDNK